MKGQLLLWVAILLFLLMASASVATTGNAPSDLSTRAAKPVGATSSPTSTTPLPPTATSTCVPLWDEVPSPNIGTGSNFLNGIASIAPDDIWAVGYYTATDGISRTLTLRWNGQQWGAVLSPNAGMGSNFLKSVSGTGPNDVWAVGYYIAADGIQRTLTLHWGGQGWDIVPSPNTDAALHFLESVKAISPNDAWAVGYRGHPYPGTHYSTLTIHWNGMGWNIVPSPDPDSNYNFLEGITATAGNDVWAVGAAACAPLFIHWDGSEWQGVSGPPIRGGATLYSVDALSPTDIWAVGGTSVLPQEAYNITEHWDGTQWSDVPVTSFYGYSSEALYGVDAIAPDDVWTVGNAGGDYRFHWDGGSWRRGGGAYGYGLRVTGVSAVSANDIWAVGQQYISPLITTTTQRYWGGCRAPITPTTTATPTSCPIQYTDVAATSTFYPYIHCLACQGVISGYADGTFRPNNTITRGQVAKIISNAAGLSSDPGSQRFEDVPPASTFFVYVQRLANLGIVSGYSCGGTAEPCVPPDNRPYFRTSKSASRGQIAKQISQAANLYGPPGEQRFEDVPPASTYYTYTQRVAIYGIAGGYPCDGLGEPCGPAHLAYFRPNNPTTRGQAAKMVSLTFFPSCSAYRP